MEFKTERDQYIGMIGQWLLPFFPNRVAKLEDGGFTLSEFGKNRSKLDHVLRYGLLYRAIQSNDLDRLAQYHENYWKGDAGTKYHEDYAFEFDQTFIPKFGYIVDLIQKITSESQLEFETLCEIGSGSGQLLNHLSQELEGDFQKFIGIDLSPQTVADCNVKYGSGSVQFVAADGDRWIRENGQQKWLYMSHRGVLEYFQTERLLSFFKHIHQNYQPTILVTIEPVGIKHDLEKSVESQPYSNEYSYSHNYPYLIRKAGFKIIHTDMQACNPSYNLLAVVAVAGLPENINIEEKVKALNLRSQKTVSEN